MNKNNALSSKIKKVSAKAKSKWEKDARFRIENKKWLDYSSSIAVRIAACIEDKENFNQESLADLLKVSPQQISKILKGEQNLTLKTIGNLSDALNIELISFPPYKDTFVRLMRVSSIDESIREIIKDIIEKNLKKLSAPTESTASINKVVHINSFKLKSGLQLVS